MTPQILATTSNYTMISVKEGHHEPQRHGMAPASIAAARWRRALGRDLAGKQFTSI